MSLNKKTKYTLQDLPKYDLKLGNEKINQYFIYDKLENSDC